MPGKRSVLLSSLLAGVLLLSVTTAALTVNGSSDPSEQPAVAAQPAAADMPADADPVQVPGSPTAAAPKPGAQTTATTPEAVTAPESVAYLRQRYRISAAEATRRIALQQTSAEFAARLAGRFPNEYAGMWLDQAAGGVLRIGMTRPELLGTALTAVTDASHVRVVRSAHSLRGLHATAAGLAAELAVTEGVDVVIDQPTNSVVVLTGGALRADDPRLAGALTRAGTSARVQHEDNSSYVPKCDPLHCGGGPLLGGIRLDIPRDDGSVGGCTTGFNLRSKVTGTYYVLTAGHCVTGNIPPRHTHVDKTWHEYHTTKVPVTVEDSDLNLAEWNYTNGQTGLDYAIMPFQADAQKRWMNRTRKPTAMPYLINYWCPGGCPGSRQIRVTGSVPLASVQVGWVVCATGAGYTPTAGETYVDSGAGIGYVPGTHCGEVTGTNQVIRVRICARPGDSGGPLFTEADGKALGILNGGESRSGACTDPPELNYYAPISTILDRVNARTNGAYGFELVTAPPVVPRKP